MSVAVLDRSLPRLQGVAAARQYIAITRRLARAAARGDEMAVRRLLVRRERLLRALGPIASVPMRALGSEVRALEALTMLALGVDGVPAARRPARPISAV